jgi:ribosomal protein S18 acetylase RimI-like enzyme
MHHENVVLFITTKRRGVNERTLIQIANSELTYLFEFILTKMLQVMDNIDKVEKQKLSSYPKYYYIYFLAVDPDHQGTWR